MAGFARPIVLSGGYWTILGRIDQFAFGILSYQFHACFARRHCLAFAIGLGFAMFYWYFDSRGGFFRNPSYPSTNPLWIIIPTVEGLAYAAGIAWYDGSFAPPTTGFSRLVGRLGEYSYSIYLLHFFVVFAASQFVHERIMHISNFYLACGWSGLCFVAMVVPGYLSFRFVEAPFLKLRGRYIQTPPGLSEASGQV